MIGAPPQTAYARLLAALGAAGCRVTGTGRTRAAQCPHHDDRHASLSITEGMSRVLVRCHAGCDTDDILADLGLARRDLFDEAGGLARGVWTPWRDHCPCAPIATYDYTAEDGRLLYQVVRGQHKEFAQRRPDASSGSGWRWSLGDVRRVLYRLPRILAAPPQYPIWVTEGERDVHALEGAGEYATCNPMGAGAWRDEYAEALAGRDVLIVADRDVPGRVHARRVLASVQSAARSTWVVEAATGKDAADHLAAGHTVTEVRWWG
jgi:hypothetical protein